MYCTKCGRMNENDARFCSGCGLPLTPAAPAGAQKNWDKQCEEECNRGPRRGSLIWGLIIVLVGLWVVFNYGLANLPGVSVTAAWLFPLLIGAVIVIVGLSLFMRRPSA